MALVCFKCSAENADGALVCRQCGAALPPPSWGRSLLPEDDQFDPLSAPTLVMQHTAPAPLPPIEETAVPMPVRKSGRTLLLGMATGVLIVAAGAWLLRPGDGAPSSATPDAAAPAASTVATAAAAASEAPAAASTPPPPAAAEIASMPVAAFAAASAVPASPGASTAQAAAPASAADTRKRIPEPVARKRALSSAPAAPPAASVASPPAAVPAEPVAAPPVAPERPKTVSERCAGGNLITRGFCEQRECGRSELAADPVCVKMKDAEQRRLFQQ